MFKLRFLTSGESHGKGLIGILEGIPAGLRISSDDINRELSRRQKGYGRGGRMKIEADRAEIISGVRWGNTIGSPLALLIENKDWKNWQKGLSEDIQEMGSIPPVTRPRPGHADLAGVLKYGHSDIRNVLERSSARETAMRVALGAVAKRFLSEFGINIGSYVIQIGAVRSEIPKPAIGKSEVDELFKRAEESDVRCPDSELTNKMKLLIDDAISRGDTLGGIFEVVVTGLPPGLGSHTHWDKRLEARLSYAIMGIQAIKAVEIGDGFGIAEKPGSETMDEIFYDSKSGLFYRQTNHAGGIEGGMTNGMPIIIRAAMKPIPTLRKPLRSVDIISKEPFEAAYERSDTCAVPAASVIAESVTALVIADAFLEKFGGDSIKETERNYKSYLKHLEGF
jgi:chorismate synthase